MSMSWPAPAAWPTSSAAAALPDRRAERRRRVAEPDLDFREFCRRSKLPQSERSWDLFAAERYRRGETDIPSYEAYNPFRHRQQGRTHSTLPAGRVQQTGRPNAVPDTVLTGTPLSEAHVENIRRKLQVHSRAQIAAWVTEQWPRR